MTARMGTARRTTPERDHGEGAATRDLLTGFESFAAPPVPFEPRRAKAPPARSDAFGEGVAMRGLLGATTVRGKAAPLSRRARTTDDEPTLPFLFERVAHEGVQERPAQAESAESAMEGEFDEEEALGLGIGADGRPVGSGGKWFEKGVMLSKAEEVVLVQRWRVHGCVKSRDRVLFAHRALAYTLCNDLRRRSTLSMEDLYSEAMEGLLKALNEFDPSNNVRFNTFARHYISGQLRVYQNLMGSTTRIGTNVYDKKVLSGYMKHRLDYERRTGRELDDEGRVEMAEKIGVSLQVLSRVEARLRHNDTSLSAPLGRDGESDAVFGDTLVGEADPETRILASVQQDRTRSILDESIHEIQDPRRRTAIRLLLDPKNIDAADGDVTRQLAAIHKITVDHARKLKCTAQQMLHQILVAKGLSLSDLLIDCDAASF